MRTNPIYPGNVPALLLHNSRHYQVLSFMNGLACELLRKEPDVRHVGPRKHSDYPSIFMQDDAAADFLAELTNAQTNLHDNASVDSLLLSTYDDILH
jgi:hypothetical protein